MTIFQRGYLNLFRIQGIRIRAHWSVPFVCLMFSGFRFEPGTWVGILAIILIHELGHAFIVRRVGLLNLGIDLTGIGGVCRWAGEPTKIQRAWVAWGGVLAQLLLFLVSALLVLIVGRPGHPWLAQLVYALMWPNLFVAAFNLIPFPPFDGAEAWPLLKLYYRRRQRRRKWKSKLVAPDDDQSPLGQTLREALDEAKRRNRN